MNEAVWQADADELARVAAGDEAAFRRLYDRHHGSVVRFAYGVLQDREQARDVAHDVLIKLFAQAATWKAQAQIATWLRTVTLRECLSWRRRFLRRGGAAVDVDDVDVAAATPAPDDEVKRRQAKALLRRGLQELNPRERAIVVLHLDEDLAPHDIAPLVGLTDNATRVALHRALERLRNGASA